MLSHWFGTYQIHRASAICLSLSLQQGDHRCTVLCPASRWVLGTKLRSSCLLCLKYLVNSAISSGLDFAFIPFCLLQESTEGPRNSKGHSGKASLVLLGTPSPFLFRGGWNVVTICSLSFPSAPNSFGFSNKKDLSLTHLIGFPSQLISWKIIRKQHTRQMKGI